MCATAECLCLISCVTQGSVLVGDDVIVHCAELHDESAVHVNELSFISICERKQSPLSCSSCCCTNVSYMTDLENLNNAVTHLWMNLSQRARSGPDSNRRVSDCRHENMLMRRTQPYSHISFVS